MRLFGVDAVPETVRTFSTLRESRGCETVFVAIVILAAVRTFSTLRESRGCET